MATETRFCGAQTLLGYACPGHAMMNLDGRPLCFWHAARASAGTGPRAHWVAATTHPYEKEART